MGTCSCFRIHGWNEKNVAAAESEMDEYRNILVSHFLSLSVSLCVDQERKNERTIEKQKKILATGHSFVNKSLNETKKEKHDKWTKNGGSMLSRAGGTILGPLGVVTFPIWRLPRRLLFLLQMLSYKNDAVELTISKLMIQIHVL